LLNDNWRGERAAEKGLPEQGNVLKNLAASSIWGGEKIKVWGGILTERRVRLLAHFVGEFIRRQDERVNLRLKFSLGDKRKGCTWGES